MAYVRPCGKLERGIVGPKAASYIRTNTSQPKLSGALPRLITT